MKSIKKIFSVFVLLFLIHPTLQAREISFSAEELVTDFSQAPNFSLFSNIDTADVDGDGDQDIVVSQFGSVDQVSWLENNGGDFTNFPVHVISTATQAFSALQVIDLDQDGDQDIVGVDQTADELLWFENDGSGTTWTSHSIQQGTSTNNAQDLSVADIDGDGDLDIVVAADDSFKLYWYENTGSASSWVKNDTGIVTAGAITTLATGDFTLNGATDIVYGISAVSSNIKIVGNINGDGSSWATSTVATGILGSINDIQVADLDLDGLAEIYYNQFNNDLTKLTFDAMSLTWSSSTVISIGTQGKTQFADIDNDGDLDVMSGSNTDFSWHENTDGLGGAWTEHMLITGLADRVDSAHVVDLDNDGDRDIVLTKSEDGFVYAYDNLLFHSKAQIDLSSVLDDTHTNATHVITGQFNGDQYPDMITANNDASGLEVFFFAGDANADYSSKTTILNVASTTDSNIIALASGDLDGDGDLDLAFAADGSDSIYTIENLMNNGPFSAKSLANNQTKVANWGAPTLVASSGKSEEIQIADINADGTQDLVVLSRLTNQVLWLSNDGAWTQTIISSNSHSSINLKVADLDNNGSLDVVTGSASSASQWFSNDNGDGSSWTATTISSFVTYQLDVADMDKDGDIDVVFSGSSSQNLHWAENNGSGSSPWTIHDTSINPGFIARELHTKDIDLDGDIDILLQTTNSDLILLESIDESTELWQKKTIVSGLNAPKSFVFSDYDRDGDTDIVSKGTASSEIIKIENRGGQFSTDIISASAQNSEDSETVAVIDLTLTHNGRDADGDLQATDLHLGFRAGASAACGGSFMSSANFNPLVEKIGFYLDDGDGVFNQFVDSLITSQSGPFTLVDGQIILPLTDINGDSNIVPDSVIDSSKQFFVTLKYRPTASSQSCNSLSVYVLQFNPTYSLDTLNAQDVDSGLDLTRAYSEITMPGEQTIIASTNIAPTTTGIASQNALVSLLFNVDISPDFSDSDGDDLFFTANGLPLSLSIDGNTGVISGVPTAVEANNSPFTVNVIAKDPQGATVNSVFQLTVQAPPELIFADGME